METDLPETQNGLGEARTKHQVPTLFLNDKVDAAMAIDGGPSDWVNRPDDPYPRVLARAVLLPYPLQFIHGMGRAF